jgi:hypothetical protein
MAARLSRQLLHHDPLAADLVQLELDRGGRLGRLRVRLAFGAQQNDAPTTAHPLGELSLGPLSLRVSTRTSMKSGS